MYNIAPLAYKNAREMSETKPKVQKNKKNKEKDQTSDQEEKPDDVVPVAEATKDVEDKNNKDEKDKKNKGKKDEKNKDVKDKQPHPDDPYYDDGLPPQPKSKGKQAKAKKKEEDTTSESEDDDPPPEKKTKSKPQAKPKGKPMPEPSPDETPEVRQGKNVSAEKQALTSKTVEEETTAEFLTLFGFNQKEFENLIFATTSGQFMQDGASFLDLSDTPPQDILSWDYAYNVHKDYDNNYSIYNSSLEFAPFSGTLLDFPFYLISEINKVFDRYNGIPRDPGSARILNSVVMDPEKVGIRAEVETKTPPYNQQYIPYIVSQFTRTNDVDALSVRSKVLVPPELVNVVPTIMKNLYLNNPNAIQALVTKLRKRITYSQPDVNPAQVIPTINYPYEAVLVQTDETDLAKIADAQPEIVLQLCTDYLKIVLPTLKITHTNLNPTPLEWSTLSNVNRNSVSPLRRFLQCAMPEGFNDLISQLLCALIFPGVYQLNLSLPPSIAEDLMQLVLLLYFKLLFTNYREFRQLSLECQLYIEDAIYQIVRRNTTISNTTGTLDGFSGPIGTAAKAIVGTWANDSAPKIQKDLNGRDYMLCGIAPDYLMTEEDIKRDSYSWSTLTKIVTFMTSLKNSIKMMNEGIAILRATVPNIFRFHNRVNHYLSRLPLSARPSTRVLNQLENLKLMANPIIYEQAAYDYLYLAAYSPTEIDADFASMEIDLMKMEINLIESIEKHVVTHAAMMQLFQSLAITTTSKDRIDFIAKMNHDAFSRFLERLVNMKMAKKFNTNMAITSPIVSKYLKVVKYMIKNRDEVFHLGQYFIVGNDPIDYKDFIGGSLTNNPIRYRNDRFIKYDNAYDLDDINVLRQSRDLVKRTRESLQGSAFRANIPYFVKFDLEDSPPVNVFDVSYIVPNINRLVDVYRMQTFIVRHTPRDRDLKKGSEKLDKLIVKLPATQTVFPEPQDTYFSFAFQTMVSRCVIDMEFLKMPKTILGLSTLRHTLISSG